MKKNTPRGKLFPPLPKYGEPIIDNRTPSKRTNHDFSSDMKVLFNF